MLWLDFEFTGLDIKKDVVIEAGVVATDYRLQSLASFTTFISHPTALVRELMDGNPWWRERSKHSETMLDGVRHSETSLDEAGLQLVRFTREWCRSPAVLAGNSIHNDRKWVDRDFPELSQLLHYRMLDVSTVKLLAAGMMGVSVKKQESHHALDDIEESIDELRFLLNRMGNVDMRNYLIE